jgi:hypothetical protein
MLALAQAAGEPRGILVVVLLAAVRFLAVVAFYAITLHLAATFFLGDVPSQRAAYVAPVPAIASVLLQQYGVPLTIAVTLFGDFVAISIVYRLKSVSAAVLTLLHFAFAAVLGIALNNIFGFV